MKFQNIFSKKQKSIQSNLKIIIDHREKNSLIPSELKKLGFKIEFKQLPVADYLINNTTAIERKTITDFKSSIINKRLINQLKELKQYPEYLLIIEGILDQDLYSSKGMHENAVRGFLLSVIKEHKIPIIFTYNEKDTAKYLYVLAKKKTKNELPLHASKTCLTEKQQLQFILEGFPGIGPKTAKKLLKNFKTLKALSNSSLEELKSLIGKKAETLYSLINKKY